MTDSGGLKDKIWGRLIKYVEEVNVDAEGVYQSDKAQTKGLEMVVGMLEDLGPILEYDEENYRWKIK